jgi:hypothetical protein
MAPVHELMHWHWQPLKMSPDTLVAWPPQSSERSQDTSPGTMQPVVFGYPGAQVQTVGFAVWQQ